MRIPMTGILGLFIVAPTAMLLLTFGCMTFGLVEGLVRKRGTRGTIFNVLVACVCGFGTFGFLALISHFVGFPNDPFFASLGLIFLWGLGPILGAMVGIWLVLPYFRHERLPTLREAIFVVVGFPVATLVALRSLSFTFDLMFGLLRNF